MIVPSTRLMLKVADGFKEVFFRNVISMVKDADEKIGPTNLVQLVTSVAWMDNYFVIVPGPAGYYVTHGIYKLGSTLGWLLGYKPWYDEYTPPDVRAVAAAGGKGHLKKTV